MPGFSGRWQFPHHEDETARAEVGTGGVASSALTLEGSLGAARGPRLRALQLPALWERAFGIRAAASDPEPGEHSLHAEFLGGAGRGGGGACYLDSIKLH